MQSDDTPMTRDNEREFLTRDEVKQHPWFENYVREQMAFAGVRDEDYEFYREKKLALVYDHPSVIGVVDSAEGLVTVVRVSEDHEEARR